ncbi:MAG TPA: hypothetical protein OIL76_00520 [Veillonellaceae bacterium]|nr:hypothetical protein [Veillonellaceae bacterium]
MDKGQVNFFPFHHIQCRPTGGLGDFQLNFRMQLPKFPKKQELPLAERNMLYGKYLLDMNEAL